MQKSETETGCCPRFDPAPWDGELLEWDQKKFIKVKVCTFFYMPLNFGRVMKSLNKVEGLNLDHAICLSEHTSKWNMNLLIEVDADVPGEHTITLSGKYLSKVYEGNYSETGNWCKNFEQFARERSLEITKWYMWYTTCPKCAKIYGKNYVVVIGKVK